MLNFFLVLGLFINPELDKRFQIKGICILKKIKQATSIIMVLVIGLVLVSCRPLDDISDTTIASFSDDTKTYTEMRDDDKTNTQTEKKKLIQTIISLMLEAQIQQVLLQSGILQKKF